MLTALGMSCRLKPDAMATEAELDANIAPAAITAIPCTRRRGRLPEATRAAGLQTDSPAGTSLWGGRHWLDERSWLRQHSRMPNLELTDSELQSAAQAARISRHQALTSAAAQENPSTRAIFQSSAQHFEALAAKLEQARKVSR